MPYPSRTPFRKALVAAMVLIGLGAPLAAFASNTGSDSISSIAYAQDRRDEYSVGELLALPGDWGWVGLAKPSLAMGFVSHPLWLRVNAENTGNEDGLALFLSGPYMERVEAYVVPRRPAPTGEGPVPPEAREMRYGISGYRLDFSLPPGGRADIYVRLKTEGPISFSASIRGKGESESLENGIAICIGALLGCLAASCCMAFIILGLKRGANAARIGLYALYLLCAALFAALSNGVAFLLPWAGNMLGTSRSGPMAACALAFLACAISKSALSPGAPKAPLHRLLTASQALCLPAMAALAFLPLRAALVCCGLCFFSSYAAALSACALGSLKRNKGAPILLAAFLCFTLGLILGPFRILGLLGLSPCPDTIPGYLGIVAQAILIVTLMVQETSGGAPGVLGRSAPAAEAGGGSGPEPRRRDFFSAAVHGLKTPLSLVTAPLESVSRGEYGESVPRDHKSFGIMRSGLRSMERIVDGILDVIGAEAPRREPERESLDLPARVRLYSSEFNSAFQSRGVGLSLEAGEGIWGLCDKRDFEVIVFNLISAAMGRSRSGDKVSIRLASAAGLAVLDVGDSGPMVTSDERAALFDPYHPRGGSSFPGSFEGGIGIYQAHAVARQNGGDLTALDSGGKPGLTLRMTLPLADPGEAGVGEAEAKAGPGPTAYRPAAPSAQTPQPGGGSDSMKRILVVEDSADLLEFLEDSLSREYRVDLAANGLEALNIMKTGRIPDLIISDVMMPVMDGPTLLKQLKQSERLASIPLIFLTARNQPNERVQSIVDGAVAYIAKPFFFEELQAAIDNILKLKDSGIKEVERRLMSALHAKPDEASFHGGEGFEAKADKFGFSKQEREVASLLITGKSDKEIAAALSLSPRTVSNYMGKMLKKAQVSGRTELATRLTE